MKLVMVFLFLIATAIGQPDTPPPAHEVGPVSPQGERLEMMKIWKLTEVLDLSEDQAQKFFPRHNSLVEELEELSKQQKEMMDDLHKKVKEEKSISEKDVDAILKKVLDIEREKLQEKQMFVEKLGDILTPEQKAKYVVFEVHFRRELMRQIREHPGMRQGRGDARPGAKKRKRWK